MITGNPIAADAAADQNIPLAEVKLASFVSSLMCPLASKPTNRPAVMKYDNIQFHTGGAPVSL